jgi:mono/diheme cytochrome c family protein
MGFLCNHWSHAMNTTLRRLMAVCLALGGATAFAQPATTDYGKLEFTDKCAVCHGVDGKGNGPLGNLLQRSPPDLTQLAKKNQGVLPVNRLYAVIEGSAAVPSHGTRDMPVWGQEFRAEDMQSLREARGRYDPAVPVRMRILTLLEYISRIQAQ